MSAEPTSVSDTPQLTVVVPVRNRPVLVVRTLDSIAAQTLRPFNLIIVDSASTDNTLDVVTRWADRHRTDALSIEVLGCPTPGASIARNYGLANVATPYVLFFDSDDEMRPNHLERIDTALRERPDTDILYYDAATIDPDGWTSVKSHRHHDLKALQVLHCPLSTQRYTVRTDILRAAGGWNEELQMWVDLELGIRLLLLPDVKARRMEGDPTVWIHPTDESLTGTSMSGRAEHHAKALDAIDRIVAASEHEYLKRILHCRRLILASLYRREGDKQAANIILRPVENEKLPIKTGMKMGLIYIVNRLTGHGGSRLALKWFAQKAQKS
ncbi:MAG: glycosyltransferase [Paramuribaculum sp.]|nr:glycosyltransferase [Paramuribaculum sp.]